MTSFVADVDTYRLRDSSIVIGGSPPRLFRLTQAGIRAFTEIVSGLDVDGGALATRLVSAGAIHPVPRRASDRLRDTTVVIPARNSDPDRLRTLAGAVGDRVARVIVVDDASQPPLATVEGADVLRNPAPLGPGGSRNVGFADCSTAFVVFIDSDVTMPDSAPLEVMLGHFDDAGTAAVAPRVRSTPVASRLGRYERANSPLDLGGRPALVRPGSRLSYVPSTVVAMRTAALTSVGGFDASLRYGEDVDAVWRLVAAGWACRYEPSVEVAHDPRPTWAAWARQRIDYGSSAAPLARRHPEALPAMRITGWSPVAVAMVVAGATRAAALTAVTATAIVAARLRRSGLSAADAANIAVRLSWGSHTGSAAQLGEVVRRTWWPLAATVAVRSRRARLALVVAAATALARSSPADLPIRLADDALYGAGVWRGVLRHRETGPLLVRFGAFSGERQPT